jgi:caspase 7
LTKFIEPSLLHVFIQFCIFYYSPFAVAREDHTNADCFVCVFLSHGKEGRVYAFDGTVYIDQLLVNFRADLCPTLAGKPKLIFIQVCNIGI